MTKVISFYSFKGGSGRTVCTANIIPLLAKELEASKESPILVLDMDLDSAGLTHLLELYDKFENSQWNTSSLVNADIRLNISKNRDIFFHKDKKNPIPEDVLSTLKQKNLTQKNFDILKKVKIRDSIINELKNEIEKDNSEHFLKNLVTRLNILKTDEEVIQKIEDSIPAVGIVDISKLIHCPQNSVFFMGTEQVRMDSSVEVQGNSMQNMIDLIDFCEEENYRAIIIDSSSGRQNSAILTHKISDLVVYCLRLTNQFKIGTKLQLKYLNDNLKDDEEMPNIIVLPTAVPEKDYKNMKRSALNYLYLMSSINEEKIINEFIENGIPEVESFKWQECILYSKRELSEDEKLALSIFSDLSKKIKDQLF